MWGQDRRPAFSPQETRRELEIIRTAEPRDPSNEMRAVSPPSCGARLAGMLGRMK